MADSPKGAAVKVTARGKGTVAEPATDSTTRTRKPRAVKSTTVADSPKSVAVKVTARGKGKVAALSTDSAARTRKSRAVKNKKVADLPPKGATLIGAPTRSKAQVKQGAKEGTAVKNLDSAGPVAQVIMSIPLPSCVPSGEAERPIHSPRQRSPNPKSSTRAGKTKSKSHDTQPPKQALVQVQSTSVPTNRQPMASPVAIAAAMHNTDLFGPIERYVGLDIGKTTEFCEVRQEQVTRRVSLRNEQNLEEVLGLDTGRALVVLEACREAWYLYDLLTGWGHEVWVVDTTRVRQLGIGQHKRKNDRIDAEVLARAGESGRVPRAHVLSHASQRLRMQLAAPWAAPSSTA